MGKHTSRDFVTGIVFFGLLITLGIFTILLSDLRFGTVPTTTVSFVDIDGLEEGNDVRIDGFRGGKVGKIERLTKENRILVTIEFNEEPTLSDDATFQVASASALGGRVLLVTSGTSATPLDRSKTHRGELPRGDALEQARKLIAENRADIRNAIRNIEGFTEALNDDGVQTLSALRAIVGRIERGEGTIGMLLNDNEIGLSLKNTAARLDELTRRLEDGRGLLGALISDSKLRDDVAATVETLREIGESINAGQGTLGLLVRDERLYEKAVAVVEDLENITKNLSPDKGIGRILAQDEPWLELQSAISSVKVAADNIAKATAQLDKKNNVLGALLTDEKMSKDLRRSVESLNSFLESARENAPLATFTGILLGVF